MQAGIVENMGKFSKVAPAGFTFVKWPLEEIKGRVNLQVLCMEYRSAWFSYILSILLLLKCTDTVRIIRVRDEDQG